MENVQLCFVNTLFIFQLTHLVKILVFAFWGNGDTNLIINLSLIPGASELAAREKG